jgi:hypothetical protein
MTHAAAGNQSLCDIAILYFGSLQGLGTLLNLNPGMVASTVPAAGELVQVGDPAGAVAQLLDSRGENPATVTSGEIGVGFEVVGQTLIVY